MVLPRVKFINKKNNKIEEIKFDEKAYQLNFNEGIEYKSKKIRVNYSAMNVPTTIYEYNLNTKKRKKLKQQKIPQDLIKINMKLKEFW